MGALARRSLSAGGARDGVSDMRFLWERLREGLARSLTINPATLFAGGGVVLATVVVVYGALLGTDRAVEDAVAVSGPVFTPVTTTAPAPPHAGRAANPAAAPQVEDEVSVTRAVQAALKRAGCYGGPVNGVWTAATRAGMDEFTSRVNARLPVDRPDPVLLALLETHNEISCTAGCTRGGEDGCVPPATTSPATQRAEAKEAPRAAPPPSGASAAIRDLGGASAVERTASAGSEEDPMREEAAATAAAAAAGKTPQKATKPVPQRAPRTQPSLARQVSKGFLEIQRSLDKLF